VREIGLTNPEDAIGEKINFWGIDATIVGVVKDFQTVKLHEGMHPVLLTKYVEQFQKVSLKVDQAHAADAIVHLEKHWKETFPEHYFTSVFLDDQLSTFYKEEKKMSRLLVAFALVAVGIASIGLFGLITFVTFQRSKEVGIRKILGATVTSIATLLSKDFIVLVVIAGLLAWPIAYYAMDKWLQGFANHITLTEASWAFVVAAALSVLFALITTGLQSIKAGLANPIESLKNE
jgi:ABC-type antimicrobial peptide transport system permease subunit